jgi:hypothetical protein
MLPAIGVLCVQPSTHRCGVVPDVSAHPVSRRPDPHVPPLVQRAHRHTEDADTSCTVHKRSAITACSLLFCVNLITDLSRLAPDLIKAAISLPGLFSRPPVENSPAMMRNDLACPKWRATPAAVTAVGGFGTEARVRALVTASPALTD